MSRSSSPLPTWAHLLAAAALLLVLPAGPSAGEPDPAGDQSTERPAQRPTTVATVTLITGDVLTVHRHADQRRSVTIEPAEGADQAAEYETRQTDEGFQVVPLDAAHLVPERLDPDLFNVDKLVAAERHAGDDQLPVIVTGNDPGRRTMATRSQPLPPDTVTHTLPSIPAVAASLDAEDAATFFDGAFTDAGAAATPRGLASDDQVTKVWLDEVTSVALDDSVSQVRAPEAWDTGFDGAGTTVAILDTGVDADHPDLDGKVVDARGFTPAGTPADEHGHGTHVASIVAGTGAGSDGARPGVAPGADLVNGRVLSASGNGLTSWVIAGMEWAAGDVGADVVNMSLGGAPTDGTDPLSQAVDSLTDEHGTLFVTAAGNDGPRPRTVGAPAAADAALAVGNVYSSDYLHSSSSRGPRRGDHAIKPDITAPGVSILAARAAGTSLGTPVDDSYTRATGTSMAAPHVAGAAAILAQQHPDWDPAALRTALVTTGAPHDSFSVYQQGGGRLDVAAAVANTVRATPAPLDLGYFPYPQADATPTSKDVTYTNLGEEPVQLDLSLAVGNREGEPPADGMVTLDRDTVTLAPGEQGVVTVTVDVDAGARGLYGGYLVAEQDGEVATRTPIGFHKEKERYDLTIHGLDANGDPAAGNSSVTVMNVDDRARFFASGIHYIEGEAVARVPPGTYSVTGLTYTPDDTGEEVREVSAMADPEIEVTGDTELVLDARDANPIEVDTPAHDSAPRGRTGLTLFRAPAEGQGFALGASMYAEGRTFSAAPTEPVTTGEFEFVSRWRLADPEAPTESSFLYDVLLPEPEIPSELSYAVRPQDLATSEQEFHSHVADHPASEFRTAWRPWENVTLSISEPLPNLPARRTDYLSPEDTTWTRAVLFAPPDADTSARMSAPRMAYQPGQTETRSWYEQVVTPGLIEGSPWHRSFPQLRVGDTLDLLIPGFSDAQQGHWGWSGSADDVAFRLYEDDELVATDDRASGDFEVSAGPSRIRMELETARTGLDWWRYSTHTSTTWEFESQRPSGDEEQVLPLLLVDHHLDTDLLNHVRPVRGRHGPVAVEFTVRHQPGYEEPAPILRPRVWTSDDAGDDWRRVANVRRIDDGRFRALVRRHPHDDDATLSLRVRAEDGDGNVVEQEVVDAAAWE